MMRSSALHGMATDHPHTGLLYKTVHQPPMHLLTPQLTQRPAQFLSIALPNFTRQPTSSMPYQHPSAHGHPTSATALPFQPQFPPFYSPYHLLHSSFTSAENHTYAHPAPRSPFGTLGPLFSGLEPVHKSMPLFGRVVSRNPYRIDSLSAQLFESRRIRFDKHC